MINTEMSWHAACCEFCFENCVRVSEKWKEVHTQLLYLHCIYWRQESPKPPLTSSSSVKSTYIHRIVSSRIMQTRSIWQNFLALMTIWHRFQASLRVQRTLSYSRRSSAPLAIPTCPKDPLKITEMTDSLIIHAYDPMIWYSILYYEKVCKHVA